MFSSDSKLSTTDEKKLKINKTINQILFGIMALDCIIIDDSLFIRETVKNIIENAGHNVIATFENGPSFLNNIANYNPDVVFCDIILPSMTGLDLLGLINEGFPNTKIIMLSGVTQGEAISAALRLGAIDFIQKPVDKDRLIVLLDKLSNTVEPPSVEELSIIGVGCAILSGFLDELTAHSSSTLRKVVDNQTRSILEDMKNKTQGMLVVDSNKKEINLDPALWGVFSEEEIMEQLSALPVDLKFELEFLYSEEFINNLFDQAIMTMGSKKRFNQLFTKLEPQNIGLPELPLYSDAQQFEFSKAGSTYDELDRSLSITLFVFDMAGPEVRSRLNPDLLTEADLMKNSIFYYSLVGDEQSFQEGLFGPLPVTSEKNSSLSSLAYTTKLPTLEGKEKVSIISIFFTPVAEGIVSDYNKISFIIRTRLAALKLLEDIDKTVLRGIIDDIIDYLLDS